MTKRKTQQPAQAAASSPRPSVVFSMPEAIDPTAWMTDYTGVFYNPYGEYYQPPIDRKGLAKVARLAQVRGVPVATIEADLEEWSIPAGSWDGIVSVFCHLPPALRQRVLRQAVDGLRPGGVLLLTGYTPRQLAFGTGGPKETALLNEPADLRADLAGLDILRCEEVERDICEGRLHTGRAAVVELVARKPA